MTQDVKIHLTRVQAKFLQLQGKYLEQSQTINKLLTKGSRDVARIQETIVNEVSKFLAHLQDIDHVVVQLLTGHGPYRSYLKRFHRSETDLCDDCGDLDEAQHPLLKCPAHEDLRQEIHRKAIEVGEAPWNLSTIIRHKTTFQTLKTIHTKMVERRQV